MGAGGGRERLRLPALLARRQKKKKQATLGEVIEASKGITKGLTEIFGYINVLKGYSTTVNADRTQDIIFDTENRRKIVIPEIIIVRK